MLFIIIGCNTGKKVQLVELKNNTIEINFIKYSDMKVSFYMSKKVKLKNPYFWFAKMKMHYFVNGEQLDDTDAYPMEYWKDGHLYKVGSGKGENLYEINLWPLREKEIIFQIYSSIEPFELKGIYKSLEQYIPLAKHPLEENGLTGEKYENKRVLRYEESFSDFKRKNPELAEFLTKGDTIELEVLSPIKAKYRYDAQW